MNQQAQTHTPTLQHALSVAIDTYMTTVHTAIPAEVDKYDHQKQIADVKPVLKRRFEDGTELELPVIPNVPVAWPGSVDGSLTFPLNRGDTVLLVFSERSMDEWLAQGGVVSPSDGRKFDLKDAVAIPRLPEFMTGGLADNNTDMQLRFGDTVLRIKPDGELKIEGGNELTIKANGDIILGSALTKKLLTEDFKTLVYALHVHPAPGGTTSAPTPIPCPTELTSKVVAQ